MTQESGRRLLSGRFRLIAGLLILLTCAALAGGLVWTPRRAWSNILLNSFYLLSASLGAVFFVAIHHLSRARWAVALRRVPEAMMAFLPWAALLMLSIFLGRHALYEWSHPQIMSQDPVLAAKAGYLEPGFVFLRMAAILAIWSFFAFRLRRISLQQDKQPEAAHQPRLARLSAAFVVTFALTFALASIDWLMSLDPHWFSTMFAVYAFAGLFLQGIAMVTLLVTLLLRSGHLQGLVREDHLHDLGKLLLGFSTFWAYIWVSQYLLIWYGNLPEEVSHYLVRTSRWDWGALFLLNPIINWVVPVFLLLPRPAKRRAGRLLGVSALVLAGRWLDLYLVIMPETLPAPVIGLQEALIPLGYLSFFFWITARALFKAPLIPLNDPLLPASPGRSLRTDSSH